MLSLKSAVVFALISLANLSKAQFVDCNINGVTVATVDLDTGVCPFTISDSLPVSNEYASDEDYGIEFYYTIIKAIKYFTDIISAGRTLSIPASAVYGTPGISLYQVHSTVTPPSNSSAAIQRRFHIETRATIPKELITKLESLDGTSVTGPAGEIKIAVVDSVVSSSASVPVSSSVTVSGSVSAATETTSTVTATSLKTLHLTTTVCSDHKCTESSLPVGEYLTTTTISGVETVFTTYCPLTTSIYSTPVSVHTTVSGTSTKTTTIYATKTTLVPAVVTPTSAKVSVEASATTTTTSVKVSTVLTTKAAAPVATSIAPPIAGVTTATSPKLESGSTYIKPASTVTIPTSAVKPSSVPSAIQLGSAKNKFAQFNELLLVIPVVALL